MIRKLARRVRNAWRLIVWRVRFVGQRVVIDPSTFVSRRSVIRVCGGGSITVGRNCEIHDFAMILTYGGHVVIGDNSSVNPFSIVYGHGGARIGSGVRIAAHTVIIPANHLRGTEDRLLHEAGVTAKGIVIGDHVWLGAGCRILDGVTIGRHAVVGAGSVVTRSIPDHATAMGVPARVAGGG